MWLDLCNSFADIIANLCKSDKSCGYNRKTLCIRQELRLYLLIIHKNMYTKTCGNRYGCRRFSGVCSIMFLIDVQIILLHLYGVLKIDFAVTVCVSIASRERIKGVHTELIFLNKYCIVQADVAAFVNIAYR